MSHRSKTRAHAISVGFICAFFAFEPVAAAQDAPSGVRQVINDPSGEAAFLADSQIAMDKMMARMARKPDGDVDRDFVELMIPHHQGAIDMAQAYLHHGSNEQLRRIAQEIIIDQMQEITAMRLSLGDPLPPSAAAQTQMVPLSPGLLRP